MPKKGKKKPVRVRTQVRYEKGRMVVEALSKGEPASDLDRVRKIPRRTLFTWIARYRPGVEHALQDRHKSGRRRKVRRKCCNDGTKRLRSATRRNTNCRIACGRWRSCGYCRRGSWSGNEQEWSQPHAQAFGADPSAASLRELLARA
jgi:hypothetical protein